MLHDLASFLDYWRNARRRTLRVLDVLPPADLEWTYAPGKFSFGDLFRHLAAIERFMYAENVRGRPSAYPGHAAALASGMDGVRAYLERCHSESLAIFAELTDAELHARCTTPGGGDDHRVEVAPRDGRARGASSGPALSDGQHARPSRAADLRPHRGGGRRVVVGSPAGVSLGL